jgi:hypothetical protein
MKFGVLFMVVITAITAAAVIAAMFPSILFSNATGSSNTTENLLSQYEVDVAKDILDRIIVAFGV